MYPTCNRRIVAAVAAVAAVAPRCTDPARSPLVASEAAAVKFGVGDNEYTNILDKCLELGGRLKPSSRPMIRAMKLLSTAGVAAYSTSSTHAADKFIKAWASKQWISNVRNFRLQPLFEE